MALSSPVTVAGRFRLGAWLTALALATAPCVARSQTPDEWIKLGSHVHGGFGALIPVGIRIGLDALQRLNANRRDLDVTFYSGAQAPCACIADGVLLATGSSPGQGTLRVAPEAAAPGLLATVVIRHRKTGAIARYSISSEWLPVLLELNRSRDPLGRYEAVMAADQLIRVEQ